MREATTDDFMTCGYCKRRFEEGEEVFIKGEGWKSIVIIDDKCRRKYYSKLPIRKEDDR
jgi:hypothetical protein